jgi:hypothetical protein
MHRFISLNDAHTPFSLFVISMEGGYRQRRHINLDQHRFLNRIFNNLNDAYILPTGKLELYGVIVS